MITRRDARLLAMQALFQMDVGHHTPEVALENVLEGVVDPVECLYVQDMVTGAWNHLDVLDRLIAAKARNWAFERLSRVDRTLLRLALYEMGFRDDIPLAVSINEAIEMAREYGDEESAKFVNGILGSLTTGAENGERIDIEQLVQQAESVPGRRRKKAVPPPTAPRTPPTDIPKVEDVGALKVEKKPALRRILLKKPEDRALSATVGKSRKETVLTVSLDEAEPPAPRKRRAAAAAAESGPSPATAGRTRKKATPAQDPLPAADGAPAAPRARKPRASQVDGSVAPPTSPGADAPMAEAPGKAASPAVKSSRRKSVPVAAGPPPVVEPPIAAGPPPVVEPPVAAGPPPVVESPVDGEPLSVDGTPAAAGSPARTRSRRAPAASASSVPEPVAPGDPGAENPSPPQHDPAVRLATKKADGRAPVAQASEAAASPPVAEPRHPAPNEQRPEAESNPSSRRRRDEPPATDADRTEEPRRHADRDVPPRETHARDGQPREARSRDARHRDAEPREALPRDARHRDAEPREALPRDARHRDAEPREALPRDARHREAEPREALPRDARHRDADPREARPRDGRPRDADPREARPRDGRPREAHPREARPREDWRSQDPPAHAPALEVAPRPLAHDRDTLVDREARTRKHHPSRGERRSDRSYGPSDTLRREPTNDPDGRQASARHQPADPSERGWREDNPPSQHAGSRSAHETAQGEHERFPQGSQRLPAREDRRPSEPGHDPRRSPRGEGRSYREDDRDEDRRDRGGHPSQDDRRHARTSPVEARPAGSSWSERSQDEPRQARERVFSSNGTHQRGGDRHMRNELWSGHARVRTSADDLAYDRSPRKPYSEGQWYSSRYEERDGRAPERSLPEEARAEAPRHARDRRGPDDDAPPRFRDETHVDDVPYPADESDVEAALPPDDHATPRIDEPSLQADDRPSRAAERPARGEEGHPHRDERPRAADGKSERPRGDERDSRPRHDDGRYVPRPAREAEGRQADRYPRRDARPPYQGREDGYRRGPEGEGHRAPPRDQRGRHPGYYDERPPYDEGPRSRPPEDYPPHVYPGAGGRGAGDRRSGRGGRWDTPNYASPGRVAEGDKEKIVPLWAMRPQRGGQGPDSRRRENRGGHYGGGGSRWRQDDSQYQAPRDEPPGQGPPPGDRRPPRRNDRYR